MYLSIPPGADPAAVQPDPYLLAASLRPDAILSHHAALDLLGVSRSTFHRYTYFTASVRRPLRVDGFAAPAWAGGLEEHVESCAALRDLDPKRLDQYLELLDQKLLYAAVGWFVERYPSTIEPIPNLIRKWKRRIPRQPLCLGSRAAGGKLTSTWNIVLPETLAQVAGFEGLPMVPSRETLQDLATRTGLNDHNVRVAVLSSTELVVGKMLALVARTAARDLYDAARIAPASEQFDADVRRDWLRLSEAEREYVERMQLGQIHSELLFATGDPLIDRVRSHPGTDAPGVGFSGDSAANSDVLVGVNSRQRIAVSRTRFGYGPNSRGLPRLRCPSVVPTNRRAVTGIIVQCAYARAVGDRADELDAGHAPP